MAPARSPLATVWEREMTDARLLELLDEVGLPAPEDGMVTIEGQDPVVATAFPVGEAAALALAACGVASDALWQLRGGRPQRSRVSVRHAAASLRSHTILRLNGGPAPPSPAAGNPLVDYYRCRDGRWVHLHGGLPNLAEGTLKVLGCANEREAVAATVARWDGQALENALAEARQCGALLRTAEEWGAHPQGQALAEVPRVEIVRLGDSAPEPLPAADRPLRGVRVLDLTRILAGPVCARTLAEHGADVLYIASPNLPNPTRFILDTGHGKLSAHLDLEQPDAVEQLRGLVRETDVFSEGYRSGSLARRGLGPNELVKLRPGLIYVAINCYGHAGPWEGRPGWEQLAQTVTGLTATHSSPERPVRIPAPVCDYTTGYLAALGTMVALQRRAHVGGSYLVRASLCQTGMWLHRLGPIYDAATARGLESVDDLCTETQTALGRLKHLRPALEMSETPPRWERPVVPLGTHPPVWP